MTNPVKTVTNQVLRLHQRMILMYAILVVSISAILSLFKSSKMSFPWLLNSSSVAHLEPIFHTRKSIKFGKKTVVLDLDSWVSMHGSLSEEQVTKLLQN